MGVYKKKPSGWLIKFEIRGKKYKRQSRLIQTREEALVIEARMRAAALAEQATQVKSIPYGGDTRWEILMSPVDCKRSHVGAISELLACADLLRRGFDVYRSVSPVGECDLLILKNGVVCRVEVKTAHTSKRGTVRYGLKPSQSDRHDILALVFLGDGGIQYSPDLQAWFTQRGAVESVPNRAADVFEHTEVVQ